MTVSSPYSERQGKSIVPKKTLASVSYVQKPGHDEELWTVIHETGTGGRTSSNLLHDVRDVEVHDMRTADREFSLQDNGFTLEKLDVPAGIDWHNAEEVHKLYYPAAEKLIQRVTGASKVFIFDTTLRSGQLKAPTSQTASARRGAPQGSVHVDYDHHSAIDRLSELLPEEAEKLRETPFAIIQVWRPLKKVRSSPLGLIDVKTVDRADMTPYEIRRPERTGKNFAIHYSPNHRWYYAEGVDIDEAYVFVCYDSRLDRARFTPHSGFRDLSVDDSKVPQRESVELRSYVFWENEPKQAVHRVY